MINGPHHCAGSAKHTTEKVFSHLQKICIARGGFLSLNDLEEAYTEFCESYLGNFQKFEDTYSKCTASLNQHRGLWNRDHMTSFVLLALTGDLIRKYFANHIKWAPKDWVNTFTNGLIKHLKNHNLNICNKIEELYGELALTYGSDLNPSRFMKDEKALPIFLEFLLQLVELGKTKNIVPTINAINHELGIKLDKTAPDPVFITKHDFEYYTKLILTNKNGNALRKRLIEHPLYL